MAHSPPPPPADAAVAAKPVAQAGRSDAGLSSPAKSRRRFVLRLTRFVSDWLAMMILFVLWLTMLLLVVHIVIIPRT